MDVMVDYHAIFLSKTRNKSDERSVTPSLTNNPSSLISRISVTIFLEDYTQNVIFVATKSHEGLTLVK